MKRIICSILVVCMLLLAFVSCGYSLAEDDMSKYANFSSENQAKFAAELKKILIKDGDFTSKPAVREQKVLEQIYAEIAEAVKKDAEAKTEGTPDERDVVYYCYYATAKIKDELHYFYADKMKKSDSTLSSVQLRPYVEDNEYLLAEKIAEALRNHNFSDYIYTSTTSGKTVEGDVAYVSYSKTVGTDVEAFTNERIVIEAAPETAADGTVAAPTTLASYLCGQNIAESITQKEIGGATYSSIKINWVSSRETATTLKVSEGDKVYVTYTEKVGDAEGVEHKTELMIVGSEVEEGATATDLASYLNGKEIGKTLTDFTLEGETETKYTGIKINWRANAAEGIKIEDTTFDKETKVSDTKGDLQDLKDVSLTYYVYPVRYTETLDYSAKVLIDNILGEKLTADAILEIICVKEIAALDDDATEEQRQEIKDNAALKYVYKEGTVEYTIEDIVEDILAYYDEIEVAQKNIDNREDDLTEANTALDTARGESASDEEIAKLEAALATAKSELEEAKKKYDEVGAAKEANINKLLAIKAEGESEDLNAIIERNYKIATYDYLQNLYNEEIKNNIANEIYYFLTKYIEVTDTLPSKAVKEAYTQLYETIESDFYTGTYDTTKKISNYKQYSGNFDRFLIDEVNELCKDDEGFQKVETVKAAKAALEVKAKESVKPLVEIFLAAQVYDQVLTDKEYEEYKDELEEYYYYYILYYKNFSIESMLGVTNMKTAAQFNKLMDWILAYEEVPGENEEGSIYTATTYKYTNTDLFGGYDIGEPASKQGKTD